MSEASIIAIIVGIFGALGGVYLREALRDAKHRRRVAVRLEAYMINWLSTLREDESLFDIHVLAKMWGDQLRQAAASGGPAKLLQVHQEQDSVLQQIQQKFEKGEGNIDESIQQIRSMSQERIEQTFRLINDSKSGIMSGALFVTDEDAAYLPWPVSYLIVEVRLRSLSVVDKIRTLILVCREGEKPQRDVIAKAVVSLVRNMFEMFRHTETLLNHAKAIRQRNLLIDMFKGG